MTNRGSLPGFFMTRHVVGILDYTPPLNRKPHGNHEEGTEKEEENTTHLSG
jgi:hypothetical protein